MNASTVQIFFSQRVIVDWNRLPRDVVNARLIMDDEKWTLKALCVDIVYQHCKCNCNSGHHKM